jgi:hypothetical protein
VTEATWLVLAVVAGTLFAIGWITRERWIHRRRRQRKAQDR